MSIKTRNTLSILVLILVLIMYTTKDGQGDAVTKKEMAYTTKGAKGYIAKAEKDSTRKRRKGLHNERAKMVTSLLRGPAVAVPVATTCSVSLYHSMH